MDPMNLQKGGVIQGLIIVALLIVILSLLGVSLGALFTDKTLQDNFKFVWNGAKWVWDNYAGGAWEFIKNTFERIKDKTSEENNDEPETATTTPL